jgi:hypothetical protein
VGVIVRLTDYALLIPLRLYILLPIHVHFATHPCTFCYPSMYILLHPGVTNSAFKVYLIHQIKYFIQQSKYFVYQIKYLIYRRKYLIQNTH